MTIGFIGGLERAQAQYERIAARAGHRLEFHGGHVGGRGAHALEALIGRVDLAIVVTDVNSHGAVLEARRVARRMRVPMVLYRRIGGKRFERLIRGIGGERR